MNESGIKSARSWNLWHSPKCILSIVFWVGFLSHRTVYILYPCTIHSHSHRVYDLNMCVEAPFCCLYSKLRSKAEPEKSKNFSCWFYLAAFPKERRQNKFTNLSVRRNQLSDTLFFRSNSKRYINSTDSLFCDEMSHCWAFTLALRFNYTPEFIRRKQNGTFLPFPPKQNNIK